jgi:hypothetical protein
MLSAAARWRSVTLLRGRKRTGEIRICAVSWSIARPPRHRPAPPPHSHRLAPGALKNAINSESVKDRNNDVRATIDELEKLALTRGQFCGRLYLDRVGMSGHSFAAITTQAVSGQS